MTPNGSGSLRVLWQGGDRFDLDIRDHSVRVDQPLEAGGGDTGPTPVELFVGSLASCVAYYAAKYLRRRQLPSGVVVTARYELGSGPARVARIDLAVEAPGVPEGLRRSFTAVIEACTVHNSMRMPPQVSLHVMADAVRQA